jgi:hypothetical protein
MAESWFSLSRADQAEALEVAAAQTDRPPHLLEKDICVVWTLSAIYKSNLSLNHARYALDKLRIF